MQRPSSPLPDKETLTRGLTSVFNHNRLSRGRLVVARRQPTPYTTSFPCEIVRCQFEDGDRVSVFCKYATGDGSCSHGQRGGVAYEAEVYRQVLQPSQASTPAFYGAYTDRPTNSMWLILEYLKRTMAVGKVGDLAAMGQAARWIAKFHALHEVRLASAPIPFLTTYSADYYTGWARRTLEFAGHWHKRFPWLARLCERLEGALPALAGRPPTVIHGEYYPHNILFQRGMIRPVDWETAAIGVGEIDLATLTEGWSGKIINQLEAEYQRARWPEGPPPDFQRTLDLARVYVQLRWLGDEQQSTIRKASLWYFTQLHCLSKRLALL